MGLLGDTLRLTTVPQRVLLGALGAALIGTVTFSVVQTIDNRELASEVSKLDMRINDPATGYVVRLTQAKTNVATCTAAIDRQSTALKERSSRDAAAAASIQVRYDAEHAARLKAEKAAAAMLAREPRGATLQERVLDVDAQILGDLK